MNVIEIAGVPTEQETLGAFSVLVIVNNSFQLRSISTLDLTVLKAERFKIIKEYALRVKGTTCLGTVVSIDYTGEVARTIFNQLK
jgi:hypothetical protein